MGLSHWITEGIQIDPPIPATEIPPVHPLHPNNHSACFGLETGANVPKSVYGHRNCSTLRDLMFEVVDGQAVAIVPASDVGHKLGAPVREVEDVVGEYGAGRTFEGRLRIEGEGGEEWTIKVVDGRVEVVEEDDELVDEPDAERWDDPRQQPYSESDADRQISLDDPDEPPW